MIIRKQVILKIYFWWFISHKHCLVTLIHNHPSSPVVLKQIPKNKIVSEKLKDDIFLFDSYLLSGQPSRFKVQEDGPYWNPEDGFASWRFPECHPLKFISGRNFQLFSTLFSINWLYMITLFNCKEYHVSKKEIIIA